MRTFIAIELPQEIKAALAKLQEELKQSAADVKWVAPENIHLTLKFLGEVDEEKLEGIKTILDSAAATANAFQMRISSVGAFPTINSARVIWVGIDQGEAETKKIATFLEEKIEKLGIPKEDRTFSSHITLGRTRSSLNRQKLVEVLNNLAGEFKDESLEFLVGKITLFKSSLSPHGPTYAVLKQADLKTT